MSEENNALAELADWLETIADEIAADFSRSYVIKVRTASSIIAEIAKVRDKLGNPYLDDIENAYMKCRAIAEEGEK